MATKSEKDRAKQIQDKCQNLLTSMLRDEDNKYCVDCDSKGPRWASWNLGIFLCIRCAGIHRNLGVHISRVKSVNLDSWTPEQVVSLQQMGNSRARAVYEALVPDGFRRPQTDSSLENFIRAKYEHKKYLAREWVPPPAPKVDWDKEIDEEMEKQKKKKKASSNMVGGLASLSSASSTNASKSAKPEAIPQLLPKPNAKVTSSPKSVRGIDRPTPSNSADLLGLDTNTKLLESEDLFSGFVSAEPSNAEVKTMDNKSVTESLKSEEENFFNQPAPTEKEKTKLTKDSILALYGAAPKPSPMFGVVGNNVSAMGNISSNPISNVGNSMNFGSNFTQQNIQFQQQNQAGFNNMQNYANGAVGQQFQPQQHQQFNQVNQFSGNVNPNQFNMNPNAGQFHQFQNVPQQQFHNFGAGGITPNNQFARNTSFQQQPQQQQPQQQQQQMQFGPQGVQNGSGLISANGAVQQNQNFVQNQNGSQPNPFFNPSLNVQFGQMGLTNTTQFRNVWE